MRKTFTLFIATLFSVSMFAQDPEWLASGDEWNGETKTLTIKSNPSGSNYQYKGDFEHLVIAEGVTEIGTEVFSGCWEIIDVIIPASVTNIGSEAFSGCQSVADVYCYANPDNLTWNDGWCDDFKEDHATTCHVLSSYLSTYISKWGNKTFQANNEGVNVTFVGDLSEQDDPDDPTPSSTHDPVTWDAEYLASFESNNLIEFKNFGIQGTYSGTTTADHEGVIATISADTDGSYAEFKTSNNNTSIDLRNGATLEFSTGLGKFESIVIQISPDYQYGYSLAWAGWYWNTETKQLVWPDPYEDSETSSSVILDSSSDNIYISDITSIVFTFADESGEEPGDEPGDENKTATSVVIYGGNYYDGQFTIVDTDLGSFGVSYTLPNVYLRDSESSNTISEKSLTITSSDESVVAVSLSNFIDEEHIYRTIQFVQNDYGHAVITVSFAGDETYASSHASFDYYYIMNTNPMAACHVEDLDHTPRTNLVMTEGDRIALDVVRDDGNEMSYQMVATATTTHKSCWKPNEEINHVQFYPHAAGLDTIVYEYYRFSHFDNPNGNKEDFRYWPYRQTIKIPVTIMPYLTPVSYCVETTMELDPEGNANLSFSNTANDIFNSAENQLEIKSVVSAENLQLALDSMATGKKEWNDLLPGATTFNVAAGRGKIKINCQTVEGYELKVLIRNGGTATITQPTMGIAEVNYDVAEVSAVLVYLWPTGGSPAPQHRAPAATKDADPKAIIKSITITPGVDIIAKQDPDNTGLYYSTFFDGSYKYALPNDGTKAFVAKIEGTDMTMTEIANDDQVIPANTAVILQSPTGSFSLTPSDGSAVTVNPEDNQLLGTDSEKAAPANCYVLSGHSTDNSVTGVGFYEYHGTLAAHKAYLIYSGSNAPKRMRFIFNNEQQATGIDNAAEAPLKSEKRIENGQLIIIKNGVHYNAQGQVVK